MRDTGGHGGSSPAEINVPLIIFGTECVQQGYVSGGTMACCS